jgi:hypothetical protein
MINMLLIVRALNIENMLYISHFNFQKHNPLTLQPIPINL